MLADDLTGAGDAALALAERGIRSEIWAPAGGRPRPPRGVRAWVIDTESRHRPPPQAARRVRAAVRALRAWGADFIYKKIDSTLRGPLAAELAAFLAETSGPILVVPAFPRMGRVTRGGVHYVEGVPLHRTAFGRDPRRPLTTARLADLVVLPAALRGRVSLPDAPNSRALSVLASRVDRAAAGSAGFLEALARRWQGTGRPPPPPKPARAAVVVAGSAHPRTAAQVDFLRNRLRNFSPRPVVSLIQAPAARGRPGAVLQALLRRVPRARRARWLVTGGETAFGLIRRRGVSRWRVAARVESGVPLCRSPQDLTLEIVMKPGGFGSRGVFWKALTGLSAS